MESEEKISDKENGTTEVLSWAKALLSEELK